MNVFLQSAANSALVKVARGSQSTDLFHYKTTATPTTAPERVVVAPIGNTAAFDSIVRFEIPNYGLLRSMFVRIKLGDDAAAAPIANSYGVFQICNYIEIASQNKVICRLTNDVMQAKYREYGSDVCNNLLLAGLPNTGSGVQKYGDHPLHNESDQRYIYIPWLGDISGLMSPPNQRWDTHFVERLEVRVSLAPATRLGGSAYNLNAGCDLICNFEVLSESDRKALLTANYGRDSTLVLLNSSSFDEAPVAVPSGVAGTPQSATVDIHCKGVVKKTHIRLRLDDVAGSPAKSRTQNVVIRSVTVNGSGRQLLSFDNMDLEALFGCAIYKSTGQAVSSPVKGGGIQNILTIDWTVLKSAGYAGGVSWREIASPQIVITFDGQTSAATCQVTHEQHELLQVQPNNGRIMQSIST